MRKIFSLFLLAVFCLSFQTPVLAEKYGDLLSFDNGDVFYTKNVTKDEAQKLGEYLIASEFFAGAPKSVQLDKKDGRYQFRMVVKAGIEKDEKLMKDFLLTSLELSAGVFADAPTDVDLCDNKFNSLRVIKGVDEVEYGKLLVVNNNHLFYTAKVQKSEAQRLGEYLVKEKFFVGPRKTVQLNKENDTFQFRFVVKKGMEKDAEYLSIIKRFTRELSEDVFKNAPVEVHLCDDDLVSKKIVPMPSEAEMKESVAKPLMFNNGELYYTPEVTKEEAENLGNFLVKEQFYDGGKKTVQLTKKDGKYIFRMVVKKGIEKDESYFKIATSFASELSEKIFKKVPVTIHLCDSDMKTLREVEMGGSSSPYGTKLEFNGGDLFYTSKVDVDDAKKLGDYLVKEKFFDGQKKTVQLNKSSQTYEFRMVVKKGFDENEEYAQSMKAVARELSENVFDGKKVDIHLCDENLETLRVIVFFK